MVCLRLPRFAGGRTSDSQIGTSDAYSQDINILLQSSINVMVSTLAPIPIYSNQFSY